MKMILLLVFMPYLCQGKYYPNPRIVMVGATDVGKSALANALLGCDPRGGSCLSCVCGGTDSCTNETKIGTGPWLGDGSDFTVCDTPGFGNSSGRDIALIEEMTTVLHGELGSANTILLVLEGSTPRFSSGLYDMLRQMTSIFGDSLWDFMMIGVSKWKYDQASIDKRQQDCARYGNSSEFCKNEAWFRREVNSQLQEKFDLTRNFTFAFIDSSSQSVPNLNDTVQQQHYQEQTTLLWLHATSNNNSFEFMTIDEVLEENAKLKEKNLRLHDIIDENITELYDMIHEKGEIIDSNRKNLSIVADQVDINKKDINGLENTVDKLAELPVGTIIAWVSKPTTDDAEFADLPDGWVRCDGSTIPHQSIWAGKLTPDLSDGRFLRGSNDAHILLMEDDQIQDHHHYSTDSGHSHSIRDPGHSHSIRDHGHSHGIKDPGHSHSITDPGHSHSIHDPGHKHAYTDKYTNYDVDEDGHLGPNWADRNNDRFDKAHHVHTETKKTGITLSTAKTRITGTHSKGAGITGTESKGTGITGTNSKAAGISLKSATSGISVTGVSGGGFRYGDETRPKNMRVIYIMRVY